MNCMPMWFVTTMRASGAFQMYRVALMRRPSASYTDSSRISSDRRREILRRTRSWVTFGLWSHPQCRQRGIGIGSLDLALRRGALCLAGNRHTTLAAPRVPTCGSERDGLGAARVPRVRAPGASRSPTPRGPKARAGVTPYRLMCSTLVGINRPAAMASADTSGPVAQSGHEVRALRTTIRSARPRDGGAGTEQDS